MSIFTEPQAAKILHTSTKTLKRLRARGILAFTRATPGNKGRVLYRQEYLDAYLDAMETPATSMPTPAARKYSAPSARVKHNTQALLDIL